LPDTMHDDMFDQHQARIEHRITEARQGYPALWQKMIRDWKIASEDAAWLTYAANYLFHTDGVKWALDPFSLFTRLKEKNPQDFTADLDALDAVVLSHAHADHLDMNILAALNGLPIIWVVPEFMLDYVGKSVDLKKARLVIPQPGIPLAIGNLTLVPFRALHMRGDHGVPEMGYLAEFAGERWAFPGDTRVHPSKGLPILENVDGLFAHLWLGKKCALQDPPPLLDEFCQFFARPKPKRIIVTHMEELGRNALDYWTMDHYQQVHTRFQQIAPKIKISPALMGQAVSL
jgi:hypothetical protein